MKRMTHLDTGPLARGGSVSFFREEYLYNKRVSVELMARDHSNNVFRI